MAKFCQDWVSKQVNPVIRPRKRCCAVLCIVSPESKEALHNEGELKLVVPSFYMNDEKLNDEKGGKESKFDSKEEGKSEAGTDKSKKSKHKSKEKDHKSKEGKHESEEAKHKPKEAKHKSKEGKHTSKEKKEKTAK